MSFDPLFALLVIVVLALPYIVWLIRADALVSPHWPAIADLSGRALHWAGLLGGLLFAISGIVILAALNSGWFSRNPEESPIIFRPPVDPLARDFVYFFAIGPALAGSLISGLFDLDRVVGGAGIALLMSGLATIVATGDLIHLRRQRVLRSVWAAVIVAPALAVIATTLFLPWTGSGEVATSLPATAIAQFFRRQLRAANQPAAPRGERRCPACDVDHVEPRASPSVSRRDAGTDAVAEFGQIQRNRRRRGLARVRHGRHAAGRYRAAVSRPRARSAAGVRVAGERTAAAACGSAGPSCGRRRREPDPDGEEARFARASNYQAQMRLSFATHADALLLRMRTSSAPALSRSRANPATPCACRTASATDTPDGTWRSRGSRACRCRSRTSARGFS